MSQVFGAICILFICICGGFGWPDFDIDFYIYNKANIKASKEQAIIAHPQFLKGIISKNQKCYSNVVFIIHGFTNGFDSAWLHDLKDAILSIPKNKDTTVFIVDWEDGAAMLSLPLSYITTAKNAITTGNKVGEFIIDSNIDPKKVHCIGHSLGAHACGFASKYVFKNTGKIFKRISGLDPAGPIFDNRNSDGKLYVTDAEFVDVVHTDACLFGHKDPIGHVDFYPNGGVSSQPTCPMSIYGGCSEYNPRVSPLLVLGPLAGLIGISLIQIQCSHAVAVDYYIESILKGDYKSEFEAVEAFDYKTYQSESQVDQNGRMRAYMGYWSEKPTNAYQYNGKFFLSYTKNVYDLKNRFNQIPINL